MSGKEQKLKFIAVVFALGALTSLWACKKEAAFEERGLISRKVDAQAGKVAAVSAVVVKNPAGFDHRQKDHRAIQCSECHQRDPQSVVSKYPYHNACAKCHAAENYLQADSAGPLCATCHQAGETIDEREKSRLKNFPDELGEFGLKEFSHRLHLERGDSRKLRCESCHQFDSRMIVADFPSHPECYSCHAHAADQKLGECQTCHADNSVALKFQKEPGPPSKLYNFKHSAHLKQPRIGANCNRCHQITETRTEMARSDIVRIGTPSGLKHRSACWQCHAQAKEPVCSKCHVGGVEVR